MFYPFLFWDDDENPPICGFGEFADGRSIASPDSEQILLTGMKYRKQNHVSVEKTQDRFGGGGKSVGCGVPHPSSNHLVTGFLVTKPSFYTFPNIS